MQKGLNRNSKEFNRNSKGIKRNFERNAIRSNSKLTGNHMEPHVICRIPLDIQKRM